MSHRVPHRAWRGGALLNGWDREDAFIGLFLGYTKAVDPLSSASDGARMKLVSSPADWGEPAHQQNCWNMPEPVPSLPSTDNEPGSLEKLRAVNQHYKESRWPAPFDKTKHSIVQGDARDISFLEGNSVHLVVTSPPYWSLKKYEGHSDQMGEIKDYRIFLDELDKVWTECNRVLVAGGRVCCVVGDVCIPRKSGRHRVMPLHADIQVRAMAAGFDVLTPIFWHKIANGSNEAEGNGAGFYGKPYQPGAIVKNDIEYILFFRKPGAYRSVTMQQKALSLLTKAEMQTWFRSIWSDVPGASTRGGHPAPYPVEIAERLIKMFSFAGDTILDPFSGSASTTIAAIKSGRNSIGVEVEPTYVEKAVERISEEIVKSGRTFDVEFGSDK